MAKTITTLAMCMALLASFSVVACNKNGTGDITEGGSTQPQKDYRKFNYADVATQVRHLADTADLTVMRVKALRKK